MNSGELSDLERRRYGKHIMLPEVSEQGQVKLKYARVLVVGAGGLGCPVLQYLCAAGVGNIGIVEYDVVNDSNLQRQILYGSGDVGKLKSIISRDRLTSQNNNVNIEIFNIRLKADNALDILEEYDLVVDATDNYESRYIISDCCLILNKPLVHGAIYKFEGQVAVFNYKGGPTYRCYNPESSAGKKDPGAEESGLLGVLPGITGTLMATEVIKILLDLDGILSGKVLIFNIIKNLFYTINISTDPGNRNIEHFLALYKDF